MKRLYPVYLLLVLLVAAACGGSEEADPTATPSPETPPTAETTPEAAAQNLEGRPNVELAAQTQPYFGVTVRNAEPGTPVEIFVAPGSPAAAAGLMNGDLITAIDGEPITQANLLTVFDTFEPGQQIAVTVDRESNTGATEQLTFDVTLGSQPAADRTVLGAYDQPFLGVRMIFDAGAAQIVEMARDGMAAEAGLQIGDRITAVDDEPLDSTAMFLQRLAGRAPGETLELTIDRNGEAITQEVTLALPEDTAQADGAGQSEPAQPGGPGGLPFDSLPRDVVIYAPEQNVWIIESLIPVGPLAESGLQDGDRIVSINGQSLTPQDLALQIPSLTGDEPFTLTVERGDDTVEVDTDARSIVALTAAAQLGAADGQTAGGVQPPFAGNSGANVPFTTAVVPEGLPFGTPLAGATRPAPFFGGDAAGQGLSLAALGISTAVVDPDRSSGGAITVPEGARVLAVIPESAAAEAGIESGDVILEIEGTPIGSAIALAQVLRNVDPETNTLTMLIQRGEDMLEAEVSIEGLLTSPLPSDIAPIPIGTPPGLQPQLVPFTPTNASQ
ncbi:MAG: hypothetical protein OHK0046_40190 [Anaerolineae bacterium]